MPVLAIQQQSDWENNIYVLTTTRILVIVGVTYLFRSLYQWARPLMERLPLANVLPWAAAATSLNMDLSLDDLVPDSTITSTVDTDLSDTPNVRPPQPTYDPSHRPQSPRARSHPSPQSHQCSMPSHIPTSISSRMVASNDESGSGGSASEAIGIDGQSL
ncbi:hypothetical protein JMJ35_009082 [Cladonia borealis]|uniref:Uncharacterized protein n=1 Tax=Cladonia borealis TaxID=184061 RepID=A0AA39QVV5_9LECA|nr:hypothetical protein JMJ35_009082 [Cladonia borealis]